ncbi:guanylate kinase [Anaerospora sp.]|jgi:guanylate kinase|uniref:guanylate kinase n=1 Tax=Anaerospora sp. TaxID=1960278 RepID=UPI00289E8D25|nr:guanylate kinase [Anaerospora sp.]MDF2928068.1 gmk 2 [Anaerospora sp.]
MTPQGILIVLSGPSGTGKGTICRELLRSYPDLHYSISATTRAPRPGEQHGTNYFFLSHAEFQTMIQKDDLLEFAEVYGNYYGTPQQHVMQLLAQGKDVVLEIDIQGAMQVKTKFSAGVFIYIVPPSLNELSQRIYKRGTDSPEVIRKRLNCVSKELLLAHNYDYIVVNDKVEDAVKQIAAIISAERCKVKRNNALIEHICHDKCRLEE